MSTRINSIDEMIEALQEAKERLGLTGREQLAAMVHVYDDETGRSHGYGVAMELHERDGKVGEKTSLRLEMEI